MHLLKSDNKKLHQLSRYSFSKSSRRHHETKRGRGVESVSFGLHKLSIMPQKLCFRPLSYRVPSINITRPTIRIRQLHFNSSMIILCEDMHGFWSNFFWWHPSADFFGLLRWLFPSKQQLSVKATKFPRDSSKELTFWLETEVSDQEQLHQNCLLCFLTKSFHLQYHNCSCHTKKVPWRPWGEGGASSRVVQSPAFSKIDPRGIISSVNITVSSQNWLIML